ncbi:MAG: photosystem I reaction center subunit PsaK [Cyanobacteria bacterium P01_H01_bin.15]
MTPHTVEWSPSVGIVMVLCNLFVFAIGRKVIQNPGKGPDIPAMTAVLGPKFGAPELLAVTSLGHVLGAGMILGLSNAGVL